MKLDIKGMTTEEKLQAMEMLWEDICRNTPDFNSPEWHKDELKKREGRIKEGKEKFINWEDAKKNIRDSH